MAMASEKTLSVVKAHRVSRHVSFQAVVPPSVAFPVNYSGPSALQTRNHAGVHRDIEKGDQVDGQSSELV